MALVPLLVCIIVAGAAGLPNRRSADYTVCETDACRAIGESIRKSIDKSFDPCTNFYSYACGLWPVNHPIPSSELEWSTAHLKDLMTSLRLKEILEEESEYDNLEPIKKLKQYYNSCMDEDAIERQGLEYIQSMIDATGGWPIQLGNQESNIKNYTWQEVDIAYMHIFATNSFLEFGFLPEEDNATKNILVVSQDIGSYVEEEIVKRSERQFAVSDINKMIRVLTAFKKHKGIETSREKFIKDISELLIFQQDLKNISEHENEIQKGLKKDQDRMTIAELQEYYDQAGTQNSTAQINWLHMIQELFKSINKTIDASYPVLVYNKHLFHKLAHLLDTTSPHVIVSYIQWNLVSQLLPYLTKQMRDIEFKTSFGEYLTEQKPRWKMCVGDIPLQDALSVLFVKKYHLPGTIAAVTEMLNDLKAEMKERILNSEWTSNNAKNYMIEKIDNIISQIGYPDWYNNQTALIERYKGLEIGEHYLKNRIASVTYENNRALKNYMKPVDRSEWLLSPITLNAIYAGPKNLMVIPAAEIQDPYFTPGMPLAINYGVVGMVVGHELAHSFDTTGIEYDKFGNKIQSEDTETSQAFDERVKCFVNQYNNFTLVAADKDGEPVQLNGLLTKDENVADNIGLEAAFAAFQKRKQKTASQPKLPGLTEISDEELFFLAFANDWCMTRTETVEAVIANTDAHSPNKFRILGILANMEAFSNVFNCPIGSSLNREPKCTLWK